MVNTAQNLNLKRKKKKKRRRKSHLLINLRINSILGQITLKKS